MARQLSLLLISLLTLNFAAASILVERQRDPFSSATPTFTTDTMIKPTANARYSVNVPIEVVWYIPETPFNANGETFNVTIALGGKVAMELSNAFSYPGYGEHDTKFTPDETWPESSRYQIFIFMDSGTKTLTSPNFGVYGGGKTPTPTPSPETSSTSTKSTASKTSTTSSTTSEAESKTTSKSKSTETSPPSPTNTEAPPAAGVSSGVLGGAIGGSIAGTLAIVGLVWFMRKRMADSRKIHGSPNPTTTSNNNQPPSYPNNNNNGGQQWPYQQMGGAHSTTSVNNEFKGFVPQGVNEMPTRMNANEMPTPMNANEMPTQMHQEPIELHSMPNHTAEMPGDNRWNVPPPPPAGQQGQQGYVYGPQSYNR